MPGDDEICGSLFSHINLEDRVRADHPLRPIREIANAALAALSGDLAALYSGIGRPLAPREEFAAGVLLSALGTATDGADRISLVCQDRPRRPGVGHSSFSKNREHLLAGEIAAKLLTAVLSQPRVKRLLGSRLSRQGRAGLPPDRARGLGGVCLRLRHGRRQARILPDHRLLPLGLR